MRLTRSFAKGAALLLGMTLAARLWAFPELARQTKSACAACHTNPAGGVALTEVGKTYKTGSKPPTAETAKAAEYVGSNRCKSCHAKQYKSWSETPHARSMAGLHAVDPTLLAEMGKKLNVQVKDKPTTTAGCVKCHVTGFELGGGYPAADSTKQASLAAVGCESCHGPGSLHVSAPMAQKKALIFRNVKESMCRQCHTAETSPRFDFAEYRVRGVHAVAAKTGR